MKFVFSIFLSIGIFFNVYASCMSSLYSLSGSDTVKPVNKNASPEAIELLNYLYSISGKKMLTAQHENLGKMSRMTDSIYKFTGKKSAIWGGEFGFADSTHDIDNISYRSGLVPKL